MIDKRSIWVDWCTAQAVKALRERGVRPLLLKGPAIATWLYPELPRARPYHDIDLLVRPSDRAATERTLADLGYLPPPRGTWLRDEPPHALEWVRPRDGSTLDLHRTLHGCEHLDDAVVWDVVAKDTETLSVGGVEVDAPSREVRALHLALHALPGWGEQSFADLAHAVSAVDLTVWKGAAGVAERLGVDDEMGFRLGQVQGGAPLASALGLSTSTPARYDRDTRALRWAMRLPGWRVRTRYVVQKLFPPRAYLASVSEVPAGRTGLMRAYGRRVVEAGRRLPAALAAVRRP